MTELKRHASLTEEVVRVRRTREVNQEEVLLALCSKTFTSQVIIFSGTKEVAHRLKIIFGLCGLKAVELHGNLIQVQRLDALEVFRKQEVDFLIATDVAARIQFTENFVESFWNMISSFLIHKVLHHLGRIYYTRIQHPRVIILSKPQ